VWWEGLLVIGYAAMLGGVLVKNRVGVGYTKLKRERSALCLLLPGRFGFGGVLVDLDILVDTEGASASSVRSQGETQLGNT
jgi:hypothetical protein